MPSKYEAGSGIDRQEVLNLLLEVNTTTMRRRTAIIVGIVLSLALFLAACQTASESAVNETGSGSEELPAAGKLVIYSGRSESLVQPIIDQFAEAANIDVDVRYGSTSELAGVLLEEGAKSPADVFYAQDPGGLGAVQSAGLLAQLPSEILQKVPPRFASEQGDWLGISGRARTVVYNTDVITDPESELPDDMFGFVDPQWNGRIGWAPTNGSFQAMVTAMRDSLG